MQLATDRAIFDLAAQLLAYLVNRPRAQLVEEPGMETLPATQLIRDALADRAADGAHANHQIRGTRDDSRNWSAADFSAIGEYQPLVPELLNRKRIPRGGRLDEFTGIRQRGFPISPDAWPRQKPGKIAADLRNVALFIKFDVPIALDVHLLPDLPGSCPA